jgi:hypothetical protein
LPLRRRPAHLRGELATLCWRYPPFERRRRAVERPDAGVASARDRHVQCPVVSTSRACRLAPLLANHRILADQPFGRVFVGFSDFIT